MKSDQDRSRESGGKPDDTAAKLREQAAVIAVGAWLMAGFELDPEPEKPRAEEPDEPA